MKRIGCIADDLTGATDVALAMAKQGVPTGLAIGAPKSHPTDFAALIIALKSRSCPAAEALVTSAAALNALREWGATRFLFKVCSTFDSTPAGNIGPVGDMLANVLTADIVPVCPAYPVNGRTVYQGHLFVHDRLLSDSSMANHPITPMRESDLRKVLAEQSSRAVALIDLATLRTGVAAVSARMGDLARQGYGYVVIDAIENADLSILADASDCPLMIGGAALGGAMAAALARHHTLPVTQMARPDLSQPAVILAGSCSVATFAQIAAAHKAGIPAFKLDLDALRRGEAGADAVAFVRRHLGRSGVLIYSSESAESVIPASGGANLAQAIEACIAEIAAAVVDSGVRRVVVAGGETSGAVVQAIGVKTLTVGPEIDPGVPWMQDTSSGLVLALKSGNFGAPDFFIRAAACS